MSTNSLRIAFLTPEFVTELTNAGGLATYLGRMAEVLREAGHRAEIVTLSRAKTETIDYRGVPVHRVQRSHADTAIWRAFVKSCKNLGLPFEYSTDMLIGAWLLARRFRELDQAGPYDVVQSSDYGFAGLFVPRRSGRRHVIRCSWVGDLFMDSDHAYPAFTVRSVGVLERRCLRKADCSYAPSRFVAAYYRDHFGLPMQVLRPPLAALPELGTPPSTLPPKFLLHFGLLCERKGTDVVAAALPEVWSHVPDFQMVWAGKEKTVGLIDRSRAQWGDRAAQVIYTGPLGRSELCATVTRATATVLPSRLDNLPNTVIESLALGVPVVGSAGASIDELIVDGHNGLLAPVGDVSALARAMIRAWRLQPGELKGEFSASLHEMSPAQAVARFIDLVSGHECRPADSAS